MKSSAFKTLSVIGAGGHARSVIALLQSQHFIVDAIYDNSYQHQHPIEYILKVPLVGNIAAISNGNSNAVVLAVGSNHKRANFFKRLNNQVLEENVVHRTVLLEQELKIGKSNLIFPKVFVNACVDIGDNNIINSAAIIEHECVIGTHNHISVNVTLCGRVRVGNYCFIGAGAVVKDKVKIGDNVTIGAGGVVVKDIEESGIYVGNPVKRLR